MITAAPGPTSHENLIRLWSLRLLAHSLNAAPTLASKICPIPTQNSPGKPEELPKEKRRGRDRLGAKFSAPRVPPSMLERVTEIASLLEWPLTSDFGIDLPALKSALRARIRDCECILENVAPIEALSPEMRTGLRAVYDLLQLSPNEELCLAFLVMLTNEEILDTSADRLGCELDDRAADAAIAATTGLPVAEVGRAFSKGSRLMRCQLIKRDAFPRRLFHKFDWCSLSFPREMRMPNFDPIRAMRDRVAPAPAPKLAFNQFSHLGELLNIAKTYAQQSLAARKSGVNFLLHGAPGTGKTEFVRVLARELNCELFEVSAEDSDGDAISGLSRLQALRLVQEFTSGRRAMVVFDEIEDVFPRQHSFFGPQTRSFQSKGWVNRMVETNPMVTFWLTNAVDALDPALVRRFDLVIKMKAPPSKVREAQLRALPLLFSPESVAKLIACADLTPGVVQRAASVVQVVAEAAPGLDVTRSMELLIDQTLQAQGHSRLRVALNPGGHFDPACINSDFDPVQLVAGLRAHQSARICLYGPPGTGKTACAQWIARELELSLQVRRASDLLSPYVGVAEKQIAAAFQEAQEAGAALLIDEVDSFLQDRAKARQGWEVTQVNEFLTQLESFSGVLLTSTNLIDGFDPAAMRRFDLKAKFDFLRSGQARRLLQSHLGAIGKVEATAGELARLDRCDVLTPGDFAAVARQHRFRPFETPSDWITALENECRHKLGRSRPAIGFGAAVAS